MKKRRSGLISQEDHELWQRVAATAEPMHKKPKPHNVLAETNARPGNPPVPAARLKPLSRIGQAASDPARISFTLAIDPMAASAKTSPHMDRRNFDRLRKGKMVPDARLDLHGMRVDQAHGALNDFILNAHARGARLVLIITGKGSIAREDDGWMPVRRGVLRHSVPHWLRLAPLASLVVEVTEAHAKHGGGGAYYVYLRRAR